MHNNKNRETIIGTKQWPYDIKALLQQALSRARTKYYKQRSLTIIIKQWKENYAIKYSNLANWPKRPWSITAMSQSIDSRLPTGNPKLLVDVDVKRTHLQGTLTLLQKYQQSKGEYRVYSARLMAGGVHLHKAIFVFKTRGRRSLTKQTILKGDKRATTPTRDQHLLSSTKVTLSPQPGSPHHTQRKHP